MVDQQEAERFLRDRLDARDEGKLPVILASKNLTFDDFVGLRGTWAHGANHSERSACMTSTRPARAAGSIEATTAAPNSTNAETTTGNAPGIFKPPK